jgi:hypothetical protein
VSKTIVIIAWREVWAGAVQSGGERRQQTLSLLLLLLLLAMVVGPQLSQYRRSASSWRLLQSARQYLHWHATASGDMPAPAVVTVCCSLK